MTPAPGQPAAGTWKEFDQNVITHSAAHHLMAIDDLVARLGYARVSDVARQLHITRGSVSISLGPLKKGGLVEQDENRHLKLSEHGRALVTAIKTKRQLIERFLGEVLGVSPTQADIDACKLEHLVSNETAQRLVAFLRYVDADDGRGRAFLDHWRSETGACGHNPGRAGATPGGCPTCETTCAAAAIDAAPPAAAAKLPAPRRKGERA